MVLLGEYFSFRIFKVLLCVTLFSDMAPEMVILMHERKKMMYDEISSGRRPRNRQKYNKCVDWWSLGVTMYTLLTGSRPFKDDLLNDFVTMVLSTEIDRDSDGKQYAALFQEISK